MGSIPTRVILPRHTIPSVIDPNPHGADNDLYRLLVETVRDYAIFALDPTGHVLSWNPGAQRFKGWESHEIIGQHFSVFYDADDKASGKPERELEIAVR